MKAKGKKIDTKMELWVDLGVCLVLIPCLVSVFPVNEWILWRASDVIVYLLWTYLCWYLGRHAIPSMSSSNKRWTALAVVFIATVLTYLMSLKQVSFPREMIADRKSWGYMANFLEQFGKHVNRYNGKTYAEDPAIPVFELINEPLYEKDFPKEDITAFVNALVDGLRKSGTAKPIFFSVWQNTQDPVSKVNIQGVTHGWYPSGLLNKRTLTANYLPKVDTFLKEFYDPVLKGKARMIYEFDCADIHQTTMYPAMAMTVAMPVTARDIQA